MKNQSYIIKSDLSLYDIINRFWVTEIYEGYTIKQAKKLYKEEHYELKKKI